MEKTFDEIQVFDGVAERTGVQMDRAAVRGHAGVCRSMSELHSKSRRRGDGFYYLAPSAWPADTKTINLAFEWTTFA